MSGFVMLLMILIPLLGALFVSSTKDSRNHVLENGNNVSIWVSIAEIFLILYVYTFFDLEKNSIQLVEKYQWLKEPPIDILLGADNLSMLLLFSINLSFLIAEINLVHKQNIPKPILAEGLIFLSLFNGYILAADIVSFYIFFAAINIPLIMLISTDGRLNKKNMVVRFSLYNLIGILCLLISVIMIYISKKSNIPLNMAGNINLSAKIEYFVWLSLFLAFISRMPIWPFHYWIASVNSTLRHPLVFVIGNLMPLVGLYGFMRFWPNAVPSPIAQYTPYFEIICIITMVFIALLSLNHRSFRYKLFAYTTVYYLLYLISVFLPTGNLKMNIGYALFSYIIIITILSFLISHIEQEKKRLGLYNITGMLCYMPRTSICLSLFVLAGIGLPITPLFWNNFMIVSEIFNYHLMLGVFAMASLLIVALALLEELYLMKDKDEINTDCASGKDISRLNFIVCLVSLFMLFLSFFKPLWFVF